MLNKLVHARQSGAHVGHWANRMCFILGTVWDAYPIARHLTLHHVFRAPSASGRDILTELNASPLHLYKLGFKAQTSPPAFLVPTSVRRNSCFMVDDVSPTFL